MKNSNARAPTAGTVWLVRVAPGDVVAEGDELIVIESMKMEIPVLAEAAGRVLEILVVKDDMVAEDQVVAVLSALAN